MASEKAPSPPPAAPAGEPKAVPPKKGGMKMAIAAAAVVLLEVGTIAVTMKLASGPKPALASAPTTAPAEKMEKDVEVKLFGDWEPNMADGILYQYDMLLVAKVSEKNKEKVSELFSERESAIRDHVRTLIASCDPKELSEPGLETVRRKISYQLEQDMGKDLIKEVLVPKFSRRKADF
jgi:flagellar basal body-associated protein FliL